MEISPVPHRPPLVGRLWLLVAVAVLAPVILLEMVPVALGLQRYVVTTDAMGDAVPKGSLVLTRDAASNDLRVGDVITFRPPPPGDGDRLVTRRVERISFSRIRTAGDESGTDPWTLDVDGEARARMVAHIPYVGYPFIGQTDRRAWLLLGSIPLAAVLLALATDLARRRQRHRDARRLPAPRREAPLPTQRGPETSRSLHGSDR